MGLLTEKEWSFIEENYPNYSKSDNIAILGDFEKILTNDYEDGDCADSLLKLEYNNNPKNPHIKKDYRALANRILDTANKNFSGKL